MSNNEKMTAKQYVQPKLRFPEFQNTEDWEKRKLGKIVSIINEKAGNKKFTPMSITSGVGLVSQMEKFGREIAGTAYKNYFIIRKNDFAYNKSSTKEYPEGYIALYSGDIEGAVPNSIFTCFRVQNDEVYPKYLNYLFSNNIHGKWLRNFITVGARAHGSLNIDNNDLLSLPIPLPKGQTSNKEQQKIADCLSSIDELITAENKKLDALKAYKKGLMQQLFPAEGETLPKLRFSEFQNAQDWKRYLLGSKSVKIGSGITPNGGEKNYKSSGRPFIRSQNVGWGELLLDNVVFLDNETHLTFPATEIKEDDVLLNITGASIGRSVLADKSIEGGNVNQHVCIIRVKSNELLPKLLNQYLLSAYGQNQIDGFQAGGNRQGLNFAQIKSFSIPLPNNIQEQQKIAHSLASVDSLILSQSKKINVLKTHKKGLMQQLFPIMSE